MIDSWLLKFVVYGALISFSLILLIIYKILFIDEDFLIFDGKYNEAIVKLLVKVRRKRKKWKYYLKIGYCYYMTGNVSQAIEYFERTLTVNKKSVICYFYLSILHVERESFDQALFYYDNVTSFIQKSGNKEKVKDFELNDSRGWVNYKKGNLKESFEYYEKAINESNKAFKSKGKYNFTKHMPLFSRIGLIYLKRNTPMFYRFGMIYLEQGKKDEAIKQFERSIKYGGPENIFSMKSKEELEKLGIRMDIPQYPFEENEEDV